MAGKPKQHSPELIDTIRAKYQAGGTQYTIADELGVSQALIRKLMARYGIPRRVRGQHPSICKVHGCGKPSRRIGFCSMHHTRLLRYGDPEAGPRPKAEPRNYLIREVLPFTGTNCLDWPYSRNSQGYGMVVVDGKPWLVSRYVCQQVWGPPPTKAHHAAHSCGRGDHGCCNPSHLSWKTPKANNADKVAHGTAKRGEASYLSKITAADVLAIRGMAGRKGHRDIARMFGISRTNVGHIINRETWRWLPDGGEHVAIHGRTSSTNAIQRCGSGVVA